MVKRQAIAWRLQRADLLTWLTEPMPVFLIVYAAVEDRAHWLYLQHYYGGRGLPRSLRLQTSVTVSIPLAQQLNESAVQRMAQIKRRTVTQAHGAITHED